MLDGNARALPGPPTVAASGGFSTPYYILPGTFLRGLVHHSLRPARRRPFADAPIRKWLNARFPLINTKFKNDYSWAKSKDVKEMTRPHDPYSTGAPALCTRTRARARSGAAATAWTVRGGRAGRPC